LVKEAAVIPAALRAGVRTPRVVAFDDTCSVVDVPYMVLARAPGVDLASLELPAADTDRVFHQVGRERWLTGWFDRLSAHLPADPPQVLVHGDIAPQNLLVSPGTARLTGIVDWGDAQWADPATDFAKFFASAPPAPWADLA
ncbi:phosphotransferase, partial [Nonomuraea sp. RK-328]|nr:phosphotransferase [Nonomuraea sp. RK-328]